MNILGGQNNQDQSQEKQTGGGGLMGKLNNTLGGGQAGERKEGPVDKGIDFVQEHVLGQGPQDNESALEQAKDDQIGGVLERGYKGATGKDMPFTGKK